MLAYGVVFVLLIGEIDLSISYISGVAGVVVAAARSYPGARIEYPAIIAILAALAAGAAIGAFQGSIIALIGVPSFVVTLAGFEIWQGVVLQVDTAGRARDPGPDGQRRLPVLLLGRRPGGSSPRSSASLYVGGTLSGVFQRRRHGVGMRDPILLALKLIVVPLAAFVTVGHLQPATAACPSRCS